MTKIHFTLIAMTSIVTETWQEREMSWLDLDVEECE